MKRFKYAKILGNHPRIHHRLLGRPIDSYICSQEIRFFSSSGPPAFFAGLAIPFVFLPKILKALSGKETSEVIEKEERDAVSPRIVKVDSFNNPAWGGSGVGSSKGSRLSPMTVRVRYDRIGLNSVNKSVTYPIGLQQAMGEKIKAGARSSSESVSLLALFIDKQEPCCHKSVYGKQGIILAPLTIRI